jgi:hypothetical protein
MIFSVVYTWHCERHLAGQYDSREEAEYWAQHMRDHQWHSWVENAGQLHRATPAKSQQDTSSACFRVALVLLRVLKELRDAH